MIDTIICGDSLEVMRGVEDKSVKLIVADPPYNIGKAEWDKIDNYIEWCQSWILECQKVLADNGSFYIFHNDFMQIIDLASMIRDKTEFVFKQLISWDKKHDNGFAIQRLANGTMRNYYGGFTEYILYYTFQDETGLTTVMLDTNNFPSMRGYFKALQEWLGLNLKAINRKLGHRKAEHCFYWKTTQWDMPTAETYQELIDGFEIDHWRGFREYESLRQEYESLRYTFNLTWVNDDLSGNANVWNYPNEKNAQHPTQKPVALIENIIKHSSNEGDVILDPFAGSCTTAVACKNLNRRYICIEKEQEYCDIGQARLDAIQAEIDNQPLLFAKAAD